MGLAAPRSRAERASEWISLRDGTRLETAVIQPVDLAATESCLLLRSDQELPCEWAALFAEQGHVVVMQQCRGRHASEGKFEPFVSEAEDGADTIDWIRDQPWFGGRLGLAGFGYAGFTAWAALSRRPESVHAMAVGLAARDPHQSLYLGGALQLEWALHLAGQLSDGPDHEDLSRAVRMRPVLEADRVALRRMPWYREWLEHPEPDTYWKERTPEIPTAPPPTLLFAGIHHPTLAGQLRDYAHLSHARSSPELVIGPWGESPLPRRERSRATGLVMVSSRAMMDFFARVLPERGEATGRARVCVAPDHDWWDGDSWPPAQSSPQPLYLHGGPEEGTLSAKLPKPDATPARFVYDPADPRPTLAGASVDTPGTALPIDADWRGDALRFQTDPIESDIELVGPACLVLYAESDAPCTDFTARLTEADTVGNLHLLGEGIARVRDLDDGAPHRIEIQLHALGRRLRAGSCLRVEIASASFPRFDRHPNVDVDLARCEASDARPVRQTIHHSAEFASHLMLYAPTA
jgi:putative CocE/NonD family hydrolase